MDRWDLEQVKSDLEIAFNENSEVKLLEILKANSFLFYELYSRKYSIYPPFHEIKFGNYRCDFAWLNDSSDGPEWVLVEIEKPNMQLFTQKGDPTQEFNHAIQQVKNWDSYFKENPHERRKIFGAVGRFRFILVAGSKEKWSNQEAITWRRYHNSESIVEIRSYDVFNRAFEHIVKKPDEFWSFAENPNSLPPSSLNSFWQQNGYLQHWRKYFNV